MQWYLLDYDTKEGEIPFVIVRKYYTNEKIKNDTIELLMSKFSITPEVAGSLYFTEYEYEYTKDGKQFTVAYQRHYDMLGNEVHGTVYDDASEATKKVFYNVSDSFAAGKSKDFAMPKPAPAKAPARRT